MKKPVRAIDMRRTATVLDFAVVAISETLSRAIELRWTYLSSPSCDLGWTMQRLGVALLRLLGGRVNVRMPEVVRRISGLGRYGT
jgi:hypothetical protein